MSGKTKSRFGSLMILALLVISLLVFTIRQPAPLAASPLAQNENTVFPTAKINTPPATNPPITTVVLTITPPATNPWATGILLPTPTGGIITATLPPQGYNLGRGHIRSKPTPTSCGGKTLHHFLQHDDGRNPDLYSSTIELGQYIDRYVEIKGVGTHNIVENCDYWEVYQLTLLPEPTPTSPPTAVELSKFTAKTEQESIINDFLLLLICLIILITGYRHFRK